MLLLIGLLAALLLLNTCGAFPIGDLKAVKIARVPASALPTGNYLDDLRDAMIARHETLLKITLEGDAAWVERVRSNELNGYAIVTPCALPDREVFSLGPYAGATKVSHGSDGFDRYRPAAKRILYDVFIPATGEYRSRTDFNKRMPSYDLAARSADLCVRFAGGAMTGAYAKTNLVRVELAGRAR